MNYTVYLLQKYMNYKAVLLRMCTGHVKLVFEQLPLHGSCGGVSVCAEAKKSKDKGESKKGEKK